MQIATIADSLNLLYEKMPRDSLSSHRAAAWKKFETIGLPQKKSELFQYVPLRQLYDAMESFELGSQSDVSHIDMDTYILPECRGSALIFIDGIFRPELSRLDSLPIGVEILTLQEAYKSSYGMFLKHRLHTGLEREADPFVLLNSALSSGGVFVYVPPKLKVEVPIQCIHVFSSCVSSFCMPRAQVFLGSGSECEWISSIYGEGSNQTLCNGVFDVAVEDMASFKHVAHTSFSAWGFEAIRATLKKHSKYSCLMMDEGGSSIRSDAHIRLLGEGAHALLHSLTLVEDSAQSHSNVAMVHEAPHCRSEQLFKAILADRSRFSFAGKIYVAQEAQKTEAYQLTRSLLLSDLAIANSKPNLEIFADDVKASHGATVSQVDDDQVLYLRMRGISESEARALLSFGFCKDILDAVPYESLRLQFKQNAQSFFNRRQ